MARGNKKNARQQRKARKEEARRRMAAGAKKAKARRAEACAGYRNLEAFFLHAGVRTTLTKDDVHVGGRRVCHLLALRDVKDWSDFLNRVAAGYCSKQFIATLVRNLHAAGTQAFYDRDLHGFRIEKDGRDLAVVRATSAVVWGESAPRHANFLTDGPHWKQFRRDFETALKRPPDPEIKEPKPTPVIMSAERPRIPTPPPMTVILGVPDEIPFDLAEAALEASRRIREERRLVFDHEVVLHYRDGDLKLRPLRGSDDAVEAPFAYTRVNGVRDVRGVIGLSGAEDPLPIRLDTESAGPLTGWIWACALMGFASVTCIDLAEAPSRTRRKGNGGQRRSSAPWGGATFRSAPRVRSSASIWPQELSPVGRWASYAASYVAGHIRHLYDGRSASAEARERARSAGLTLGPDETYVRPHARGLPDHALLEFDWRCDAALLLRRS